MSNASAIPVVSVDRAAWYHLDRIDLDFGAIAAFYEALPIDGKPALGDCRIHFSALGYVAKADEPLGAQQLDRCPRTMAPGSRFWRKYSLIDGVHLLERSDSRLLDPVAPPADVLVFLGTAEYDGDYSRLTFPLGQQLTAYAHGPKAYAVMTAKERELRRKLEKRREHARQRAGTPTDAFSAAMAAGLVTAATHAINLAAGTSLPDFGRDVASDAGSEAADTVIEEAQASREELRTIRKISDYALSREGALKIGPPQQPLAAGAIRLSPRREKRLRAPIVITSQPRPGLNEHNHRQRSFRRIPLIS